MGGWTSTARAAGPSPPPRASRPSHGRCRPCPARRAAVPRARMPARGGDTAGAPTSAETLAAPPAASPVRFPAPMRVLIFHGYLLHGTGSNVYNAELGAALLRAGHELPLLCQAGDRFWVDWVDAAGDWDGGARAIPSGASRCGAPSTGP